MTTTLRNMMITGAAGTLLALGGCSGDPVQDARQIELPPPVVAVSLMQSPDEAPAEAAAPLPAAAPQRIDPAPQVPPPRLEPAPTVVEEDSHETMIAEGTSRELWNWQLSTEDLRRLTGETGPLVLMRITNALGSDWKADRFAFRGRRWTRMGGGMPDDISLDCRVVSASWGAFYDELPKLATDDDAWVIAFPKSFMVALADMRDRTTQNGSLRVFLTPQGAAIRVRFEDGEGQPLGRERVLAADA